MLHVLYELNWALRNLLQKICFLDVKVVNQYIVPYILNTSVKKMYIFSVDVDNSTEKRVK